MFGKKKKEPKVEQVFNNDEASGAVDDEEKLNRESDADLAEFGDKVEEDNSGLTDFQKKKVESLGSVKDKISKILKSSNIEIVDENFGDEYEFDGNVDSEKQKQQDYDSLKALFGSKDKAKTQELTLTIDDFDYTYVGQYVEEYDLMHLKGIKRIRLQKKHPKYLKKIILIASVVIVLGLSGFLAYYFMRETPVYLKSVSMNQTEQNYFLDEYFDYTGLYFVAEYSNGQVVHIPLTQSVVSNAISSGNVMGRVNTADNKIKFTGISTQSNPTYITFQYAGFSVQYDVNVKSTTLNGLTATFSSANGGLFDLEAGKVVTDDYLRIYASCLDYGQEAVEKSDSNLEFYVDGVKQSYVKASKGFVLTTGITHSSTIKISYTSGGKTVELEFTYQNGVNEVSKTIETQE